MSASLKADISSGKDIVFERVYYMSRPSEKDHSNHVVGVVSVMSDVNNFCIFFAIAKAIHFVSIIIFTFPTKCTIIIGACLMVASRLNLSFKKCLVERSPVNLQNVHFDFIVHVSN